MVVTTSSSVKPCSFEMTTRLTIWVPLINGCVTVTTNVTTPESPGTRLPSGHVSSRPFTLTGVVAVISNVLYGTVSLILVSSAIPTPLMLHVSV